MSATPRSSDASQQQEQHLVLVGGGHAHVQVIKALHAYARPPHVRITLVDRQAKASYSGMVPATIAGAYRPAQTQLDLQALAQWAKINFVQDRVVDIDLEQKKLFLEKTPNEPIPFDLVSLDLGSTSRGLDETPGAAEFCIPTRPIAALVERLEDVAKELEVQWEEKKRQPSQSSPTIVRIVVVGGGAAGVELSMAVTSRFRPFADQVECTLLHAGSQLFPDEPESSRRLLMKVLQERGIQVRHNCNVQKVTKSDVVVDMQLGSDGDKETEERLEYSYCLWATGAGAHDIAYRLAEHRGLDITKHGWIRVSPTLQSTSHPHVFAAGDCAHMADLPNGQTSPPKAGVYAVRAGPVLIENLPRQLQGSPLLPYTPQSDFLKLLVCGKDIALGFRFGLGMYGKWVFALKDHIDLSFMELFDVNKLPLPQRASGYGTAQYDADSRILEEVPDLSPSEAASYLLRSDDEVDFRQAWKVIRSMAEDESYRKAVVEQVQRTER